MRKKQLTLIAISTDLQLTISNVLIKKTNVTFKTLSKDSWSRSFKTFTFLCLTFFTISLFLFLTNEIAYHYGYFRSILIDSNRFRSIQQPHRHKKQIIWLYMRGYILNKPPCINKNIFLYTIGSSRHQHLNVSIYTPPFKAKVICMINIFNVQNHH